MQQFTGSCEHLLLQEELNEMSVQSLRCGNLNESMLPLKAFSEPIFNVISLVLS